MLKKFKKIFSTAKLTVFQGVFAAFQQFGLHLDIRITLIKR